MSHRLHSAVARANANIAFIKYWGNRDDALRLPANPSLSMTLEGLFAQTAVTWQPAESDTFILNGQQQTGEPLRRVSAHLDVLRRRLALEAQAHVESRNNFPTGAGIASSAAAFAALTVAGAAAAGAVLDERELTRLARLGSGSASRSIPAGFVEWHAGASHEESYAESIFPPDHWDLVDVIAVVSREHKPVGSTAGHRSAITSDLQAARVAGAERRLNLCKEALAARDFSRFAQIVELDSNLMHAVMMTSDPPLFYWQPASLAIMALVRQWRAEGLRVCYTLDAGPNVHCICLAEDASVIAERLRTIPQVIEIFSARPGSEAQVVSIP